MSRQHRTWPTWVIVGAGVVVTGAAIVWAGSLYDEHGEPLIDGSVATILVALLGLCGTVLALVLQRTQQIRHQVQNSHEPNLRDDLDDKHDRVIDAVEAVAADVRGIRKDHGRTIDRLDYTIRRLDGIATRVGHIEDTQPRP